MNKLKMKGLMALAAVLFFLTAAAAAGGMYQGVSGGPSMSYAGVSGGPSMSYAGVSGGPSMSYAGVSGSIDSVFANYPKQPSFPAPVFMTSEEFCQMVAAHLSDTPNLWDL